MQGKKIIIKTLVISFIVFGFLRVCSAAEKFVPLKGKILFFAGQNIDAIEDYIKTVGIVPAGFMTYTSVQNTDSLAEQVDIGAGPDQARYFIDKYPNTALQIGLYMVDALEEVSAGDYDGNIDYLASFIKDSNRPVFLRIGYEFDGPHNHYDPAGYVKAFRYIVDRFRKKGVNNVAFVWHSFAAPVSRPLTDWYPGDEYVDWFGVSFFDQRDEKLFAPMIRLARLHLKPMMVAEASPARTGTAAGEASWNGWFRRYFDFIEKNNIRCFCYINVNWDSYPMFKEFSWGDCRLSASEFVKQHWLEEIKKEKYLMSSEELYNSIGFKPVKKTPSSAFTRY